MNFKARADLRAGAPVGEQFFYTATRDIVLDTPSPLRPCRSREIRDNLARRIDDSRLPQDKFPAIGEPIRYSRMALSRGRHAPLEILFGRKFGVASSFGGATLLRG